MGDVFAEMEENYLSQKVPIDDSTYGYIFSVKKVDDVNEWHCHLCNTRIQLVIFLESHVTSEKHQEKLKLPQHPRNLFKRIEKKRDGVEEEPTESGAILQSEIDAFKGDPLVGLEHLLEIQPNYGDEQPSYLCTLCTKKADRRVIFFHLTSFKHCHKYLTKYFPVTHKAVLSDVHANQDFQCRVMNICKKIEEKYGRLKPTVCSKQQFESKEHEVMATVAKGDHISESAEDIENLYTHSGRGPNGTYDDHHDIRRSRDMSPGAYPRRPYYPGKHFGPRQSVAMIQRRLDTFKGDPLVGLEHLVEIQPPNADEEPFYFCMMCRKQADQRVIFVHLNSLKHYQKYLKKFFPYTHDLVVSNHHDKQDFEFRVMGICKKIEDKYGRLKPVVCSKRYFETNRTGLANDIADGFHFRESLSDEITLYPREVGHLPNLPPPSVARNSFGGFDQHHQDIGRWPDMPPMPSSSYPRMPFDARSVPGPAEPVTMMQRELGTFTRNAVVGPAEPVTMMQRQLDTFTGNALVGPAQPVAMMQRQLDTSTGNALDAPAEPVAMIQRKLDTFKGDALVGLEYLVEIQSPNVDEEPSYFCMMCDKQADRRVIFVHLNSLKHYQKFLTKYFPITYEALTSDRHEKEDLQYYVMSICKKIEEKYGRLKPVVCSRQHFENNRSLVKQDIAKGAHIRESPEDETTLYADEDDYAQNVPPHPVARDSDAAYDRHHREIRREPPGDEMARSTREVNYPRNIPPHSVARGSDATYDRYHREIRRRESPEDYPRRIPPHSLARVFDDTYDRPHREIRRESPEVEVIHDTREARRSDATYDRHHREIRRRESPEDYGRRIPPHSVARGSDDTYDRHHREIRRESPEDHGRRNPSHSLSRSSDASYDPHHRELGRSRDLPPVTYPHLPYYMRKTPGDSTNTTPFSLTKNTERIVPEERMTPQENAWRLPNSNPVRQRITDTDDRYPALVSEPKRQRTAELDDRHELNSLEEELMKKKLKIEEILHRLNMQKQRSNQQAF